MASESTSTAGTTVEAGSQLAKLLRAADSQLAGDAENPQPGAPWSHNQDIQIKAVGGLYNRERRRFMIAAANYKRVVAGNRDIVVTGDHRTTVAQSAVVRIGPQPVDDEEASDDAQGEGQEAGEADPQRPQVSDDAQGEGQEAEEATLQPTLSAPGRESLTVDGDASMEGHDRRVSMGGIYNRTWGGGVIRMAGLEGIICGGGFVRMIAGPAFHGAQIVSGDVYGGALHAAATRVHAAGFGYRSAELAAWACGIYVRATGTTFTPAITSPSRTYKKRSLKAKMGRIFLGLCPPVDIMVGLAGLAMLPLMLIIAGINKLRGVPKKPVKTNPRALVRTIGFKSQTTSEELNT